MVQEIIDRYYSHVYIKLGNIHMLSHNVRCLSYFYSSIVQYEGVLSLIANNGKPYLKLLKTTYSLIVWSNLQ